MDETKEINCKICQKKGMKRLGFHVRRMHQLSMPEYEAWMPKEVEPKAIPQPEIRELTTKTVLTFLKEIFKKVRSSRLWAQPR
jgi:hypothetical protein